MDGSGIISCPACKGKGYREELAKNKNHAVTYESKICLETCYICSGEGKLKLI